MFDNKKIEVEHRLVVISFEGDDAVARPDPRVPSAAPPNLTGNGTSSSFKPYYNPYNTFTSVGGSSQAVLSNAPNPRSFSANQFYSPNSGQYSGTYMPPSGYEGLSFYPPILATPPSASVPRYTPQMYPGVSYGYYPHASILSPPLSSPLRTDVSPGANSAGPGSGSTSTMSSASVGGTKEGVPYYFDGEYARFLARQGSMAMMNPAMMSGYPQAAYNYAMVAALHAAANQQQQQQQQSPAQPQQKSFQPQSMASVVNSTGKVASESHTEASISSHK